MKNKKKFINSKKLIMKIINEIYKRNFNGNHLTMLAPTYIFRF